MTTCNVGDPCVTTVMALIEADPEPFIFELEQVMPCDNKLCEAVSAPPGEVFGPPLEHLIGREELLAFMFSNEFPPHPAPIPLPAPGLLMIAVLGAMVLVRRRQRASN
jgi:hypothetical protein